MLRPYKSGHGESVYLFCLIIAEGWFEKIDFFGIDAGYWMLDIRKYTNRDILKHPVARNQYPESANTKHGFRFISHMPRSRQKQD